MYSSAFLAHHRAPKNRGEIPAPDGAGEARYNRCGDWLKLMVKLKDGRVADARFQARGCPAAIAVGSAGTELIIGRTLDELQSTTAFELDGKLDGVPPSKRHALWMFLDCLAQISGPRTSSKGERKVEE